MGSSNPLKKQLWRIARFGVCALALWWVSRQLHWDRLSSAWHNSHLLTVAMAFVIFLPVPFIQSLRFTWMLKAQDIRLSYWEAVKLSYTGNFFNHFVPAGLIGGDVVKAYYVAQKTTQKTEAVTAVLLDRLVGLFGFTTFALVGLFIRNDEQMRQSGLWLIAILLPVMFGTAVVLLRRLATALHSGSMVDRLPFGDKARRVGLAIQRMGDHPLVALMAIGSTFCSQSILLLSFSVAAIGLGMEPDFTAYFAYLSMSSIVAAIPISPGGLGTMEAAMIFLLVGGGCGSEEQVILLAAVMRLIQLFWAIPGAGAFLTGACRTDLTTLRSTQPSEPNR